MGVTPGYSVLFTTFFVSSLAPDLDSKNSTTRKSVALIIPALAAFFTVLGIASNVETRILAGISVFFAARAAINSLPLSHRGTKSLHSKKMAILVPLLITAAAWFAFRTPEIWKIATASFAGYASHIAADKALNKR